MSLLVIVEATALIIGALGGSAGIIMFFTLRPTKKKILSEAAKTNSEGERTEAEAAEILARASAGMLSPFEATIASLSRRLAEANAEVEDLNRKLRAANKRIGELEDSVDSLTRRVDAAANAPQPP